MAQWTAQWEGAIMNGANGMSVEERLTEIERRLDGLEKASLKIAKLMSTLGGKFMSVKAGVLTDELSNFFEEVGKTLTSVNKRAGD